MTLVHVNTSLATRTEPLGSPERLTLVARHRLPLALNLLLAVLFGGALVTVGMMEEPYVTNEGTAAQIAAVHEGKPRNVWTTEAIRGELGFAGCVAVEAHPDPSRLAVAHVVRLPVAEGWGYVRMPQAEVAARLGVFGGTSSTADDVKVVGTCY